ncbi:RM09 protein, partial [Atrichornis clamosus]|nr:RM09 protein [Atrichornis clamosus]
FPPFPPFPEPGAHPGASFPLSQTLEFLRRCRLEVGMKNNVQWELTPEIVARHFLRNLRVLVPPHALRLPEEPVRRWGPSWCDVTVRAPRPGIIPGSS